MGVIHAEIKLANSDDLALVRRGKMQEHEVRKLNVNMLLDSDAYNLAINEHIKAQLGLEKIDEEELELADGSRAMYEVTSPVDVRFKNRHTVQRAFVLPGNAEPLLGAIPMEDMDVVILPRQQVLDVNPANPYVASKIMK